MKLENNRTKGTAVINSGNISYKCQNAFCIPVTVVEEHLLNKKYQHNNV